MEFHLRKKCGRGTTEFMEKESVGARYTNPTRESNLDTIHQMNAQYKKLGAVPPPPPKSTLPQQLSASTQAEMAKSSQITSAVQAAEMAKATAAINAPGAKEITAAQTAATTGGGFGTDFGAGFNQHLAIYNDYDRHIRPLHPAFHPLPSNVLHPEHAYPM